MFTHLKTAVEAQFQAMSPHPLFRTVTSGDALWEAYLRVNGTRTMKVVF